MEIEAYSNGRLVVFEILSPGNRASEMSDKFIFYEQYGVAEYYIYDPDRGSLEGWLRQNNQLNKVSSMKDWVSPRLEIRFHLEDRELVVYRPDGHRFETYLELAQRAEESGQRAEIERQRADSEHQRAERLIESSVSAKIEPRMILATTICKAFMSKIGSILSETLESLAI